MRTPVNPDSLIEQLELFSAPSPEIDPVQHHVEHDLEKRFQTDFISNDALHEQSKLIPLSTPRRCRFSLISTTGTLILMGLIYSLISTIVPTN